jgi:diaminopimelate decarboxylase
VNRIANRSAGRPSAFSYREVRQGFLRRRPVGSALQCDEVAVERLAERFGTPLYVYSASTLRERMASFEHAFRKVPHTVCYSVKANSSLGILRLLAGMGCGFDVVSGGELERVLRVDRRAAKKVVFSGVGKTADEMQAALKAGVMLFNVESESELWRLAECAARSREKARIALRVNPDVPANTHPYISTGLQQLKFGIPISKAKVIRPGFGHKYLRIAGVSVHIGPRSPMCNPSRAMERGRAGGVLKDDGHHIEYVDAGGGLGIDYQDASPEGFAELAAEYAAALLRPLRGLKVHLLLEPGRSIVGPAGVLLTRVLYRKTNGPKQFLVVDAAMNDLLRPALYDAYHRSFSATGCERCAPRNRDVVAPSAERRFWRASVARGQRGDHWPFWMPALGMALASNYNTRRRPAEVLVDGKSVKLIRRRETMDDLLRPELQLR